MITTTIRWPHSLGILDDRTPSRCRLLSVLSNRWRRKTEAARHDDLPRLDDRLLADVGLCREHRIHHPQNRTDQQQVSPVPVALLAMWMPRNDYDSAALRV